MTIILATFLTCAFVWVRLQIISISYEINGLTKQEHFIREECNNLSLRINQAKSPQRLVKLAATRFNMQAPRADQLVTLTGAN